MFSCNFTPEVIEDVYLFEYSSLYNVYKCVVLPHCNLSWFGFDIKNLLGNLLIEALHIRSERTINISSLHEYLPSDVLTCFLKEIEHYADGVSRIAHENLRNLGVIITHYTLENNNLLVHTVSYVYNDKKGVLYG
jgi:hypothetical protein